MAVSLNSYAGAGANSLHRNLASSIALRGVRSSTVDFQRVSERLATGQRINRASDDPSGLVMVERLRHQIAGTDAALQNILVADNTLSAAQDGMSAILDRLNKLKSVALQAIGGSAATSDTTIFQDEADQLLENIDQIVQNTNIGGNKVLDGSGDFNIDDTNDAFDQIRVKRAAFPANGEVSLDVGVARLAERATIVTNIDLGASRDLSSNLGQDVLTIAGEKGSAQIPLASSTTSRDMVAMINGAAEATGVYASSHIVNGAEALVNFADLDTDLELAGGNTITFDVQVGGSMTNVTLTATGDQDGDAAVEITAGDMERALNDAGLGHFSVIGGIDASVPPTQQNFVIRHAGAADFTLQNFADATGTINGGGALGATVINGTQPAAARIITDGSSIAGPAQFDLQIISGGISSRVTKNIAGNTLADMQAAMNDVATVTSLGVNANGQEIFQMVANPGVDAFSFHESQPGSSDARNLGLLSDTGGGDGLASRGMAVLALYSTDFGSDQQISMRNSGSTTMRFGVLDETNPTNIGLPQGSGAIRAEGVDMIADINGKRQLGRGFHLNYSDTTMDVELDFSPKFGLGSATNRINMALSLNYANPNAESLLGTRPLSNIYQGESFGVTNVNDGLGQDMVRDGLIDKVSFTVFDYYEGSRARSGLGAQLTGQNGSRQHLGIRSFDTSVLGGLPSTEGDSDAVSADLRGGLGTLAQIKRGGMYNLEGGPENVYKAIDVIDRAIEQVLHSQQYIGIFQTTTLQTTQDFLGAYQSNLTQMETEISGIDFAREAMNMFNIQNRNSAATTVLAQANSIPQNLLQLLR